jgi:hypothetical protein
MVGQLPSSKESQMRARVATFEGGNSSEIRQNVDAIKERAASGPPDGVPAVGFLVLHDADAGKVMAISLFESEEDLQQGDTTLNSMDPPSAGGMGRRVSVESFEVGIKIDS